ncbi:GNAT family N-acetyltransferase [Pontimicrobium sp. IMCC45349]|uniref:GNAT family N-acetyltransferase n=1 Tax=Pontimicrobium sp. IMCC45349 TaxID=3391574 RepID=UPI0039A32B65
MEETKLDNPVWNSLNEVHKKLSVEYEGIKFYNPDYCPFGGFIESKKAADGITKYAGLIDDFYVVGKRPMFSIEIGVNKNLVCNQMLLEKAIDIPTDEQIQIVELKSGYQKRDLYNLVNLVQPGYFKSKTSDLGKYFGIYSDTKLIAVTGERMKMNGFTEISAVVTHPQHTGKGYAKQLIKHTTNQVLNENKIPYLHVAESNIGAIKLYEKLGFITRRKISFWNLKTI